MGIIAPEPATELIDITSEFGVTTADNKNAARINEAIETLGKEGKLAYIGKPGNYGIEETINIGNGTETAVSTYSGGLIGVGFPVSSQQTNAPAAPRVQLTWRGATNGVMLKVLGPIAGVNVKKLFFHGNGKALTPIESITSQWGEFEQLLTFECLNGITILASKVIGVITTNHMHNRWRQIAINYKGLPEAEKSTKQACLLLDTPVNNADVAFDHFSDLWLSVPKTSAGNEHSAIYLRGCDSNVFENIHPIFAAGGADNQFSVSFDYGGANKAWPEGNLVNLINLVKAPRNVAAPVASQPNIINNISGANGGVPAQPGLENLQYLIPAAAHAEVAVPGAFKKGAQGYETEAEAEAIRKKLAEVVEILKNNGLTK